jgi:hypothetical protein
VSTPEVRGDAESRGDEAAAAKCAIHTVGFDTMMMATSNGMLIMKMLGWGGGGGGGAGGGGGGGGGGGCRWQTNGKKQTCEEARFFNKLILLKSSSIVRLLRGQHKQAVRLW